MASVTGAKCGDFWRERHRDLCRLLKKWRHVEQGREAADSCTQEMLAFLGM